MEENVLTKLEHLKTVISTEEHEETLGEEEEEGKMYWTQQQIPLLFIDVNLGDTKPRITLFEGDEPKQVAKAFAYEHDLDEEMEERLVSMLKA